ncbi:cyclic pyranopterin phosphate synthase MoaA [Kocuria flava]|uniref:GTP 3',8-cyclase n=1 Tax=Kocuria flava TaxID=446860 RepID=A0A0U3H7Q5_9MICC|nr:GTP 3',8-cyclase MoaA [Kocuria flava]ALU38917.1 cyclic pyranopterin phosphate synthase MoaA [Kocuria flava]GEO93355.1 cyclic pyranopterin monophosphate synthase [Kocuria flava]
MSVSLGLPQIRSAGPAPSPAPPRAGLVDRHGRRATDLRLSVIDKCNLRCTYCMPADGLPWLPAAQLMTPGEITRIVGVGVRQLGVTELRLTGGEPLVRRDLEDVVAGVRAAHRDLPISLTTNGIGLAARAPALARAGLTRINISLDSLDAETFRRLARRDRLADVLAGAEAAAAAGLTPVKINAVLMRGINDHEAPDLLAWALEHGFALRFIEQMPLDADHGWTRADMVTAAQIRDRLATRFRLVPHPGARDGAPAELWDVRSVPAEDESEPLGTVGIIASVTEPFCADCTRTRITAEGRVRSCLFSHEEVDLLDMLRAGATDAQLAHRWRAAMWAKPAAHGMEHTGLDSPDYVQPERSMSAIGG